MFKILTLTTAALFLMSEAAFAAAFMKLGDIKGEATDSSHKDWINIESFSFGVSQPAARATGATRRRGVAVPQDVTIIKQLDRATPLILQGMTQGMAFPEVIIEHKVGQKIFEIHFNNVFLTSVSLEGLNNEPPTEEVTFTYQKIEWITE